MVARCSTLILYILLLFAMTVAFGPLPHRTSKLPVALARRQPPSPIVLASSLNNNNDEEDSNEESSKDGNTEDDTKSENDESNIEELGVDPSEIFEQASSVIDDNASVDGPEIVFMIIEDDDVEDYEDEEDEDEEDEDEESDPYSEKASSEFLESHGSGLDWGGALGTLRERVNDVESGASQSPSNALFRIMTSQTPNQAIGNFINTANPQVVAAMSGAVSSLLGGLSSPAMGVETIVRASGEKIGSLCFQLQMTGYMFRNAEYVLAIKDIMNLKGSKTVAEYKAAFDRLDADNSGFIETNEIEALLREVYQDDPPAFEIKAFMDFFDVNGDGKISWGEFEKGLGDMTQHDAAKAVAAGSLLPTMDEHDDEDDEYVSGVEPDISGTIELELKNGKTIEVCAKEYMTNLKKEANALKAALKEEKQLPDAGRNMAAGGSTIMPPSSEDMSGGIASYIASREGDLKSLTEGISPEVVDTMKQLVDFVLAGGDSKKGERNRPPDEMAKLEMELPGAALQQLALWQLVLGYRLREAEAKGDYVRLLDN